jgi:SAM-dependent methyltransferase
MTIPQSNSTIETDTLTARVRSTWTSGDFGRIARSYERGAAEFIARLELEMGDELLDVACGTGNLALPAARAGATVTGVDIAPNLIAQAKARAVEEQQSILFDVGDAEALPYADQEFDIAVSMFGAMFAARPDRAAAELIRVVRSGGRIAMANWTPMGFIGEMLKTTQHYAPAPVGVLSPLQWGTEYAVHERLGSGARSIETRQRLIALEFPFGPVTVVNEFITWYGPLLRAYAALDFKGRNTLRQDLETLWSENNRATDGSTYVESEYLEVLVTVK